MKNEDLYLGQYVEETFLKCCLQHFPAAMFTISLFCSLNFKRVVQTATDADDEGRPRLRLFGDFYLQKFFNNSDGYFYLNSFLLCGEFFSSNNYVLTT